MLLTLLTRILIWAAVGLLIWYVLLKFIPRKFLTWFGGAILLALVVLSFLEPNDETISTIWRIISQPLTPLGFSVLLLLFSLSDGLKKVKGRYVAVALTILVVSSIPWVARNLVGQAEQAVQVAYQAQLGLCEEVCPAIPETTPLNRVVAMVVVGENMDLETPPDAFPSQLDTESTLNPSLVSRLNSAANFYGRLRQNGSSPAVIVTAGPISGSNEEQAQKEEFLRQRLVAGGIPREVITIQDTGMDINATVDEVRTFLEDRQQLAQAETTPTEATRIAIVAPALEMRRVALTFENRGLQVVAWPTDLYGLQPPSGDTLARLSDLVPSVEALQLTTRYWEELLTSIYYFLRGWLPGFDVRWNEVVEVVPQQ